MKKNLKTKRYLGLSLFFMGFAILAVMFIEFLPKYTKVKSLPVEKPTVMSDITDTETRAIFAGGCFWCSEKHYEELPGVSEVISGYTGGFEDDPTYDQVSGGQTGHREAVLVKYDPSVVTYQALVDHYWLHINPTDSGGQFYDRGFQYSPAIYYYSDAQKQIAETAISMLNEKGIYPDPIVTPVLPAGDFFPAEDYHQDYYKNNQLRYQIYTNGSGRFQYVESIWGEKKEQ